MKVTNKHTEELRASTKEQHNQVGQASDNVNKIASTNGTSLILKRKPDTVSPD